MKRLRHAERWAAAHTRYYRRWVVRRARRLRRTAVAERVVYHRNKRRHLQLYKPDARRAPAPDVMASFVQNGVTVVRDFLPRDVIEHIAEEVEPPIEALAADRYRGPQRTHVEEDGGLFRIYEVENFSPSSRAFFDSPFLAEFADSVCATGMHSKDRYVDYKNKIGGADKSVDFHIDHWKVRFKAFLLLQDVTDDQAPLVYVAGSHRRELWRWRWDWGYEHKETEGALLRPEDVARICSRYGYQQRTLTGSAGDLILADTSGIHRGTRLRSGTRLQLVNLFVMNGAVEYAH